jgi:UPF0176 protein
MSLAPFEVLLYYRYVAIPDPVAYMEEQRALCESLGLRGRILIGQEGINGTVSGPVAGTRAYREAMAADPLTHDIAWKIDPLDDHVFPKLSIKVRSEIVGLGLSSENDIDPNALTGERLDPVAFYEAMQDPEAVLLDARNHYETDLGRFKGAICPGITNFRDFPAWFEEHAEEFRGKKILTYCTGGIRCEKLSGYLRQSGCEEVYQLKGGIVSYGKDPEVQGRDFDGLCYVFDQRVGVEVNSTETRCLISHCSRCGTPEANYRNCQWPECNAQIFICVTCLEQEDGIFCDDTCLTLYHSDLSRETPAETCH